MALHDSVGRTDDVITLESGEKVVPIQMEGVIVASPLVQGVIMFGRERNQVGVLVEPSPEHIIDLLDENAVVAFKNEIWSVFTVFSRLDDNYCNADVGMTGQ